MLLNLLLRVVLVLAGLVLGASVVVAATAMIALWGARAAWSLLTGRPVSPFIVRLRPFDPFAAMAPRRPQPASRTPRADAASGRIADVTDVEPK